MRILFLLLFLAGCSTTQLSDSVSRDRTMESMAKAALINQMLQSPDPVVRNKGADAAAEFLKKEKRSIFDF